jgi:hypothetical protein
MKEKNQIMIRLSFFMKIKIKEIFNFNVITIFYILKLTLINSKFSLNSHLIYSTFKNNLNLTFF